MTLTLTNYTSHIRRLCPYAYIIREDFLLGGREGITPPEDIHQRLTHEILPASEAIMAYDLIRSPRLPWMDARSSSSSCIPDPHWSGYSYLLFYCTVQDRFLSDCLLDQDAWLYGSTWRTSEQEHERVQPDRRQYETVRVLVREAMLLHATPTPAPAPAPAQQHSFPSPPPILEQEREEEEETFLIKEQDLVALLASWQQRRPHHT